MQGPCSVGVNKTPNGKRNETGNGAKGSKQNNRYTCFVATTIEIMTTIEIIISIVVKNKFQT